MEHRGAKPEINGLEPKTSQVSPIELFKNPDQIRGIWPELVASNPEIITQAAERTQQAELISNVLDMLPNPSMKLSEAIDAGIITEQQAGDMYNAISDIIGNDDYKRLIYYLPFQIMPDVSWQPETVNLSKNIDDFKTAYMTSWLDLLHTSEIRANFVDGDVLEVEQRITEPERAIKAAHLIPEMVKCGMLNIMDVLELLEAARGHLLEHSVYEALTAMTEMNQLPFNIMESIRPPKSKTTNTGDADIHEPTENRKKWIAKTEQQNLIYESAVQISEYIGNETILYKSLQRLPADLDDDVRSQIIIESLAIAIEEAAQDNIEIAKSIYEKNQHILADFANSASDDIAEAFEKSMRKLYRLGVVNVDQINSAGINITDLAGSFTNNTANMGPEISKTLDILASPDISRYVYPVALVGGSRVKGYSKKTSDTDVSVFIKPETDSEQI